MPKSRKRRSPRPDVPTYMRHKSGGRDRAFCYVAEDGKRRRVYLGSWGSPDSKRRFRALIAGHLSQDQPRNQPLRLDRNDGVTIEELVARFLVWAETHYVKHGRPTGSWQNMKEAAAPLLDLFRDEMAADFGPKKLRMVQTSMVESGLARRTVNSRIQRVRRIFKWGVAEVLAARQDQGTGKCSGRPGAHGEHQGRAQAHGAFAPSDGAGAVAHWNAPRGTCAVAVG